MRNACLLPLFLALAVAFLGPANPAPADDGPSDLEDRGYVVVEGFGQGSCHQSQAGAAAIARRNAEAQLAGLWLVPGSKRYHDYTELNRYKCDITFLHYVKIYP